MFETSFTLWQLWWQICKAVKRQNKILELIWMWKGLNLLISWTGCRYTLVFAVAFKVRTRTSLTPSKWGHLRFLAYCNDMYSAYKPYPCFVLHVLAIHISPHFECVDAKIILVLALIYLCTLFHTPFTLVSSLQMPGHVGVYLKVSPGVDHYDICNIFSSGAFIENTFHWSHANNSVIKTYLSPRNSENHH